MVHKVITTPTSSGIACIPVTHSLSLSRMEIKEIACRTRKELLGLTGDTKSEGSQRQKKFARKAVEEETKEEAIRSTSTERIDSGSFESNSESQRHCSTSSDPESNISVEESPPFSSSPFHMAESFDEDIVDLKWRQSLLPCTLSTLFPYTSLECHNTAVCDGVPEARRWQSVQENYRTMRP